VFVSDSVVGRVRVAFTDRHGGFSSGPWSSLNLAMPVTGPVTGSTPASDAGDDPEAVSANLTRVAETFGVERADLRLMRQVHGRDVAVIDAQAAAPPTADALLTRTPGVVLLARAADCVPVALADTERGVAAVVHAGRVGTLAGVVPSAVEALRRHGAQTLNAWIGPRICGSCYEVPADVRAEVAAVEPATWSTTRSGSAALDLAAGIREQLRRADVAVHDLADDGPVCTMESDDLFSYRRQGARSGRLGVLVQVQR
jgi:YfiH family protein